MLILSAFQSPLSISFQVNQNHWRERSEMSFCVLSPLNEFIVLYPLCIISGPSNLKLIKKGQNSPFVFERTFGIY